MSIRCKFGTLCTQTWKGLDEADKETLRFCNVCQHPVYKCNNQAAYDHHSGQGHCVYVKVGKAKWLGVPSSQREVIDKLYAGLPIEPSDAE